MVSQRKVLCVFIVVHVILSDNILRSYCLNDKNITVKTGVLHSPPPSIALSSVLYKIEPKMDVPVAWHIPAPT